MKTLTVAFLMIGLFQLFYINSPANAAMVLNCADLWTNGFPTAAYKTNYPCYEYGTVAASRGGVHHIYYAFSYQDHMKDELKSEMVPVMKAMVEAVKDSDQEYAKYDGFNPVALIMTDISEGGVGAVTPFKQGEYPEPISVLMYTTTLSETIDVIKQNVAHELWHALQYTQFSGGWAPDQAQWWVEGSANFFSNLVYPKANREFRETNQYTWTIPLYQQPTTYSTTDFFQSLANSWMGASGAYSLMGQLPMTFTSASDPEKQWQALSSFPSMEMHFHNFAKEFTLAQIKDTSGVFLPTNYMTPIAQKVPDVGLSTTITPEPFTIDEEVYQLAPGKKWRVQVSPSNFNSPSVDVRDISMKSPWQLLFPGYTPEYDLSCYSSPKTISLLVTSATGPTVSKPSLGVLLVSKDKQCPCSNTGAIPAKYIGRWKLQNDSMKAFLEHAMKGGVTVDSVTGNIWLTITDTHQLTFEHEDTVIDAHAKDGTTYHIEFTGIGAKASLQIASSGQMCMSEITGDGTSDVTITLPGQSPMESKQPMPAQFSEVATYQSNLTNSDTLLTLDVTILEGEPPTKYIFDKM